MKIAISILLAAVAITAVNGQFPFFGRFFNRPRPAPRPVFNSAPAPVRGGGGCRPSQPNYNFGNRGYVLSWLNGCSSFTGGEAQAYCASMGMHAISLQDSGKAGHFIGVLNQHNVKYFWTGGSIRHRDGVVSWKDGGATPFNALPFSRTGG